LDVETTTKNKGHPFTASNKLCLIGHIWNRYTKPITHIGNIEYDESPFGHELELVQERINDDHPVLVGFNIKFDLHWLRRYGIKFPDSMRVHDCQLAYFLETHQKNRYPSLNEVAEYYGFEKKLSVVEEEYWNKGIDTPNIPVNILYDYLAQDLSLTERIYHKQLEFFEQNPKLRRLFNLQCQDLLVLEEMEWNGLRYDVGESLRRAADVDSRINGISSNLRQLSDSVPVNWNSPEQISAVLYGGIIKEEKQVDYLFYYKDPKRKPVWKKQWITVEHTLPRLVEPLPNSSMKKENVFATGESILLELQTRKDCPRAAGEIISLLLKLAELSKLNDYYKGIPKLIEEMEWEDGYIHGNLNQCSVVTGRLSSNKPNMQNMPAEVHELIVSRFGDLT
jgi:DNA polymerase I